MIDGLVPYPKYKDSGLPWLPKIPASWSVARNGRLFTQRNKTGHSDLPILEVSLRSGVRVRDMTDGGRKQVMSDRSKYKQARAGDLAYNTMRMWQGAVGVAPVDGLVSPAYVVVRPAPDVDSAYFAHLFRTAEYMREIDAFSRGIVKDRNRLYWEAFKQIPTPRPPLEEQRAIVKVLRYASRRTMEASLAKRRMLALLGEYRAMIVHDRLTRGLDAVVARKPSGIESLGDVPLHWNVKKLHQITDPLRPVMYGIVLPGPDVPDGVFIVKGGNCEPGRLRPELLARTTFAIESRYVRSRLRVNDIVIAIRGGVGAAESVPDALQGANLTQDAARIAPGSGIDPRWLLYSVRSPAFQEQVRARVVGATVSGINIRDLKRVELVVPPRKEQTEIAGALDRELASLDASVARIRAELERLVEYAGQVCAGLVTGRLDVRVAADRLADPLSAPTVPQGAQFACSDDEMISFGATVDEAEEVSA